MNNKVQKGNKTNNNRIRDEHWYDLLLFIKCKLINDV